MFDAKTVLSFLMFFLIMAPLSSALADEASNPPITTIPIQTDKSSTPESTGTTQAPATTVAPVPGIASTITLSPFSVDHVVIKKGQRLLHLMRGDQILKTYKIALGRNPTGHKTQMGDYRTPEGEYKIDWRNPNSKFYLSMHISYPNQKDLENARRLGVPPGGDIMIHGLPNGLGWIKEMHRIVDWTKGCIAVTNEEIEEIWRCVRDGTPVRIES